MAQKFRFGFLYLDELHHVNHFIPVAVALSQQHHVEILTFPDDHLYLKKGLKGLGADKVLVKELRTHPFRALTDSLKNRNRPRQGFWMKWNRHYLMNNFDALVFTSFIHHKALKFRGENKWPKLLKLPHGIPGRGYVYHNDIKDFDLMLIPGQFYFDQLKNRDLLAKTTKVTGYFKKEAVANIEPQQLFQNSNPTVLYNPHFTKGLSSWYDFGREILDFFKKHQEFNLIFAPHINLFNRRGGLDKNEVLEDLASYEHILVDLGSDASVDMVYLNNADIYLGDVSSQSFEFMMKPRPCIFINSHNAAYEGNPNYRFWRAGDVIEDVSQLNAALNSANETFERKYKAIQKELDSENIYRESGTTASQRAVSQIETYLKGES
ncbi:CDP-glycerol glycerophosphotransferase family protein [Flavobacteriaceae bacterium TK19130]|nr:CDP-glycerol glycerophosphotransferase family protein [Thermobacterium salinum]